MIGGIDQQIQQKVDAYRENPQQLMQRYQQNQELIDLLALQKLKSEKDAAAREMQMQMQTTPQTIKQQREAELLQMTKDDMVKQTSGIMQERQKRQQQNMQRTANQGLPQLPAGNMQRMAGGGIVAFAEGGPLQQEDVDAKLKQEIELALQLGESPEALAERLKDNPNALAILRNAVQKAPEAQEGPMLGMPTRDQARQADQSRLERIRGNLSPSLGSIDTEQLVRGMGVTPLPEKPQSAGIAGMLPGRSGVIDPVQRRKEREAALAARDQQAEGVMAQREQQRQQTYESSPLGGRLFVDNRQESAQQAQQEAAQASSMEAPAQAPAGLEQLQEIDTSKIPERLPMPDKEQQGGIAAVAPAGRSSEYDALRKRYEEALAKQQDPKELTRQRQIAFKLGALANQGRGGLAGAAAASERAREVQKAQELKGIESLMGMQKEMAGMDFDQAKLSAEERSATALESLRTMQSDTQRLNVVGGLYADAKATFENALMQNTEYTNAVAALEKAQKGGMFGGVDEDEVREAARRVKAIEDRIKATMPNFERLESTYRELLDRMGGTSTQGAGVSGSTKGYSVERVEQQQ